MAATRWFFFAAVLLSIILVVASAATPAPTIIVPETAAAGLIVWRANGCASCHTLQGHGGAFAPDLTRIYGQRGEVYLREFLVNPQAFHPNQRVMPSFGLTRAETDALLSYLQWVSDQPGSFPVRAINVNGGAANLVSAETVAATGSGAADIPADPVEAGRYWFSQAPANCSVCHSLEPDVVVVGPSLAGIATRGAERIPGMSAEAYLRQSILDPGAFVVPGFPDAMARNLGEQLSSDQINHIIAFLRALD